MKQFFSAVLLGAAMLASSFAGAQVVTSTQGFSVSAPVALTSKGTTNGVSDYGLSYTMTTYRGDLPNGDSFAVGVSVYNATLDASTLQNAINKVTAGHQVLGSQNTVVSGRAAMAVVISIDSRTRLGYMVTIRGNTMYQFAFSTDPSVPYAPGESPSAFFNSATLN